MGESKIWMLPSELKNELAHFTEYNQEQVLTDLMNVHAFNDQLEIVVNQAFVEHASRNHIYDTLSLLNLLMCAMENPVVRSGVLLNLLENCFECLSIESLMKVISFLYDNIGRLGDLGIAQTFKLHRLLNTCLKKIPRSNCLSRGQLYFILSHFVNFPHESGLLPIGPSSRCVENCFTQQEHQLSFNESEVPYQFCLNYWKLQNYIGNSEENKLIQIFIDHTNSNSSANSSRRNALDEVMNHITGVQKTVQKVINYFETTQLSSHQQQCDLEDFDIDMTDVSCLLVRRSKIHLFRLTIIFQVMIYCISFQHRLIVNEIQYSEVEECTKNIHNCLMKYLRTLDGPTNGKHLAKMIEKYICNELKWEQIKKNAKEFRRSQRKHSVKNIQTNGSQQIVDNSIQKSSTFQNSQPTPESQWVKYKQEIRKRLCINPEKMEAYLSKLNTTNHQPKLQSIHSSFFSDLSHSFSSWFSHSSN